MAMPVVAPRLSRYWPTSRGAIPASSQPLRFGPREELPDGMEIGVAGMRIADGAEEKLIGGEDGRLPGAPDHREKRGVGPCVGSREPVKEPARRRR